jgi:hypothetical protein
VSIATLLAELDAAGIHLTRAGDRLRVRSESGASLAAYTERIRAARPSLLALLRERESIAELADQLAAGWRWLDEHPHHPEHEAFLDRWIARLREYEELYAAHHEPGEASCRAS